MPETYYEMTVNKQSSIGINRTSKGDYSFELKLYFDDSITEPKVVVDRLRETMDYCLVKFQK
jgi:hypothetical protein